MYSSLFNMIAVPLLRHAVTGAGAYLVAQGYIMTDQTQSLEGSAVFLAGLGWSIVEKVLLHGK